MKFSDLPHLARRTWQSYTAKPLTSIEQDDVRSVLLEGEYQLWSSFGTQDQRHSYIVLKRFCEMSTECSVDACRAALLHDIGKIQVDLSTTKRVVATFVGGRTKSFRIYHDHENIGLRLLKTVSSAETLRLLSEMFNEGEQSTDITVRQLCQADHV